MDSVWFDFDLVFFPNVFFRLVFVVAIGFHRIGMHLKCSFKIAARLKIEIDWIGFNCIAMFCDLILSYSLVRVS